MRGKGSTSALFIVLALFGAGCLTATAPQAVTQSAAMVGKPGLFGEVSTARIPAPDKDLSKAIVSDHGLPYEHIDPMLHNGSYRLDLVGYNPLTEPGQGDNVVTANSGYISITVWHDLACVAHFAGSGGEGGATIVNFSDPAKPVVVASIMDFAIASRCQFTDDGNFLIYSAYGGVNPGPNLPGPLGPLAGPVTDAGSFGITIFDTKDKAHPQYLIHDSQGQDPGASSVGASEYHNFDVKEINGTNYIFQTYTGNILAMAPDGKSVKIVAKVEHSDHDMWVGRHPITGDWVMATGAGSGTAVYNINDPTHPILIGGWQAHANYTGWHRQFPLLQTVDGRAYLVVAGEECGNGHSLPYTVLDWTDPTNLTEMGHWQIPGNPATDEPGPGHLCEMNSHEFTTWDGYVATGNYHAGVWLFDIGSAARAKSPVTVGYYLPDKNALQNGGMPGRNTPFVWNPDVWGAYFDSRGYVVTADWSSGFYVLKFPATMDGTNATYAPTFDPGN
ncbi:MAG: LVIVD repeat-containing protein [Thermoplasmatota archaeon]